VPAVRTPLAETPAQPGTLSRVAGEMPQRLVLPSLRVDAPIVPVQTLADGSLAVPANPAVLGWWSDGAHPGGGRGSVVIDGHVDSAAEGPGALFHLRDLRPGDPVTLRTDHESRSYAIAAVRSYPKASLPAEVFDTTGAPRLIIITCGGAFTKQTRQYSDNIVAYAVPAS
ncbi:MAG TPA: class F sortase, partial [Pseudonocardiaceae bacterium]|nr:class F sortase [Pseudonocardiaceae bacterium]